MIFNSPSWVPQISKLPESKLVGDFITERDHKLYEWSDENPSIICALSGKSYTMKEIKTQVSYLSRSLSKSLGWSPNSGSPWEKVVGIFSYNTVRSQPTIKSKKLCRLSLNEPHVGVNHETDNIPRSTF